MSNEQTNKVFANSNEEFKNACSKAGIPPTARQASKWRRKTGKAWKARND